MNKLNGDPLPFFAPLSPSLVAENDSDPAKPADAKAGNVIILAAHPDDEVIGASTAIRMAGGSAYVAFLTDGAPLDPALWSSHQELSRSEYATLRWREAAAALGLVGVPEERIFCLGGVDQESAQAFSLLVKRFATVLDDVRPDLVISHAYEGGHPDHDSASLVAYAAAASAASSPELWEMTSYHAANGMFRCGQFLPSPEVSEREISIQLSPEQHKIKTEMLLCYESQRSVLQAFAACMEQERFRPAPEYDFSLPPHPGLLWYETQGWPMSGEEWRRLAAFFLEQQSLTRHTVRCA